MEVFDLLRFSADFKQNDMTLLCENFDELYDHRQHYKTAIEQRLPDILRSSKLNYQRVQEYVEQAIIQ
jgi:hypothetical protein